MKGMVVDGGERKGKGRDRWREEEERYNKYICRCKLYIHVQYGDISEIIAT